MNLIGPIKKLVTEFNAPVEYFLPVGEESVALNPLLGKHLSFEFLQEIYCIHCARRTKKSFQQGYCYPCYRKLLDCNLCIIHPQRCKHQHSPCPDTWEHAHCKQAHIVYLANSSGLKVGITRLHQTLTRWMDQGAIQAIPLFEVKNRYQSGILEVILKKYVSDKTNWRKMLGEAQHTFDMSMQKKILLQQAQDDLSAVLSLYPEDISLSEEESKTFVYPIMQYPPKLHAFSLEKERTVAGKLWGIKGQYLLLDTGVFNIRKHSGYSVSFAVRP